MCCYWMIYLFLHQGWVKQFLSILLKLGLQFVVVKLLCICSVSAVFLRLIVYHCPTASQWTHVAQVYSQLSQAINRKSIRLYDQVVGQLVLHPLAFADVNWVYWSEGHCWNQIYQTQTNELRIWMLLHIKCLLILMMSYTHMQLD